MSFGRMGAGRFGLLGAGAGGGTTVAGPAPVLSVASAVDFSDTFVWGQATTDIASGTLYAVVVASAASTPTAAQIVAGTDAAGAAAPSGSAAVSSTGARQVLAMGLTAVTAYKVCMTHRANNNNSNVVTGSFTTDTLVIAYATNGLATGLAASTGTAALGTAIADPHGGTNAIRWTDSNDALTNQQVAITSSAITFLNGVNKFHVTVKHQGGAAWFRAITSAITISPATMHYNTSTGALGTLNAVWTPTPTVFDVNGWKMFSGQANLAGADVAGSLTFHKAMVDNNVFTITRNGTHIQDLYNIRITRV